MMGQSEFDFSKPPLVHKNAKDTEIKAADVVAPKVTGMRLKVLQALDVVDGMTGSQLTDHLDAWINSVKPRLTELQGMGLVEDSGQRQKNTRGNQEVVWRITNRGSKFLRGEHD